MNTPTTIRTDQDRVNAPARARREIHLVGEVCLESNARGPRHRPEAASPDEESHHVVVVPEGLSELKPGKDLFPTPEPPANQAEQENPRVETLLRDQQLRLMLFPAPHQVTRVNGCPTRSMTVLREGDQIQWGDEVVFQVAIFNRPHVGSPPSAIIGKPCPVCTVAFTTNTRVYICNRCGEALHHEESGDGLQCASLRQTCPCGQTIQFDEGYNTVPEWS